MLQQFGFDEAEVSALREAGEVRRVVGCGRDRANLDRAESCGGVGSEIRISRASDEDDNAPLLHVTLRTTSDVRLGHLVHVDRCHHPRWHPCALERVLQREPVHRGGEHADVVGGGAIHSRRGASDSAEDVSTANNNSDLDAELTDAANLIGHEGNDGRVDSIRLFAEKRLAGELQEDPLVTRCPAHRMPAAPAAGLRAPRRARSAQSAERECSPRWWRWHW